MHTLSVIGISVSPPRSRIQTPIILQYSLSTAHWEEEEEENKRYGGNRSPTPEKMSSMFMALSTLLNLNLNLPSTVTEALTSAFVHLLQIVWHGFVILQFLLLPGISDACAEAAAVAWRRRTPASAGARCPAQRSRSAGSGDWEEIGGERRRRGGVVGGGRDAAGGEEEEAERGAGEDAGEELRAGEQVGAREENAAGGGAGAAAEAGGHLVPEPASPVEDQAIGEGLRRAQATARGREIRERGPAGAQQEAPSRDHGSQGERDVGADQPQQGNRRLMQREQLRDQLGHGERLLASSPGPTFLGVD